MFRTLYSLAIIGWLSVGLTIDAQAQERQGFGPFGFGGSEFTFLTVVDEVQQELSLDDDQKELLDALQKDLRDQRRALLRGNFQGSEGEDGRPGFEAVRQRMEELNELGDELVTLVLKEDQTKRLEQLRLQRQGLRAFEQPDVAQKLTLGEEQVAKIRELRRIAVREARDLTREDANRHMEETRKQILALLNTEQQKTWADLRGKEFTFPDWMTRLARGSGRGFPFQPDE